MKTTKAECNKLRVILDEHQGIGVAWVPIDGGVLKELLDDRDEAEAAIAQAVAEEREAIAKRVLNFMPVASISAREMVGMYEITCWRLGTSDALEQAAAAIRARGAK